MSCTRTRSALVFGFLVNEVKLLERAKAYGLVADLPPHVIEQYKSLNYTEAEIVKCQWFKRLVTMLTYVKREIIPRVAIPDLELRTVWVGDDLCIHCFSLPLRYATRRYRTPEIAAQMKCWKCTSDGTGWNGDTYKGVVKLPWQRCGTDNGPLYELSIHRIHHSNMKVLAKLIETEFPPSLFCAVSEEVPPELKGKKLPPALANYRIEDLPF